MYPLLQNIFNIHTIGAFVFTLHGHLLHSKYVFASLSYSSKCWTQVWLVSQAYWDQDLLILLVYFSLSLCAGRHKTVDWAPRPFTIYDTPRIISPRWLFQRVSTCGNINFEARQYLHCHCHSSTGSLAHARWPFWEEFKPENKRGTLPKERYKTESAKDW